VTPPPALLVVGHGTCDDAGAATLRSLVQQLRERAPGLAVDGGFTGENPLYDDGPALPASVARAVAALAAEHAVREVAVVPLALGRADLGDPRVRDALHREEQRHPGLAFAYWRGPLGPHAALLEALEQRLDEAVGASSRSPSDRAATTVLLVGAGAADPEANAELYRVARLLWEGRGYAGVEVAFVNRTAPDVPAGLDRCARLASAVPGRTPRVVVLPYFLFDGAPAHRARQQAEGWAEANAAADVRFARVIGAAPELAGLVLERYAALPGGLPVAAPA
jgi:sirohydrochlorin cobaltochelatase